ncbi:methyltransferase domain-containing protein [Streptomyces sp. NPDC007905]|uniref:class I SAM-dependent methyltransferase n=1 Tax=Streptomyces sp. NPDC007905 TaxID=3364788 RepID=UPI0036E6F18A
MGAGTGSYEPPHTVLAVEPSRVMAAQRPPGAAPAVRAVAERLPLRDDAADAVLAVLTVHHWTDLAAGIGEPRRVARRRIVLLTWDQRIFRERYWLVRDCLPEAAAFDDTRAVPPEPPARPSARRSAPTTGAGPARLRRRVRRRVPAPPPRLPRPAGRGGDLPARPDRPGRHRARSGPARGRFGERSLARAPVMPACSRSTSSALGGGCS